MFDFHKFKMADSRSFQCLVQYHQPILVNFGIGPYTLTHEFEKSHVN